MLWVYMQDEYKVNNVQSSLNCSVVGSECKHYSFGTVIVVAFENKILVEGEEE